MPRLYSHVDVRVRDRGRATAFYDALFAPLGMTAEVGTSFTTYTIDPGALEAEAEWFGFTEDPAMVAGSARLSFFAQSRSLVDSLAEAARGAGASEIEGPAVQSEYGENYYAVFFEDPDGNKLEIVYRE